MYIYILYRNSGLSSLTVYFPSTKVSIIVFAEELYNIPVVSSRFGGYYSDSVILLCTGNEPNLTQCSTGSGTHQCNDHSQDAGVDACMRLSVRAIVSDSYQTIT